MSRRNRKKYLDEIIISDEGVRIEKLTPTGQGVGTLMDGMKAFFWNALPGEEVLEYRIIKKRSHLIEVVATKIKNESKFRTLPRDTQYLSTSPWQIMSEEYENESKISILKELYRKLWTNEILLQSDNNFYFYRNKMEYSLYFNFQTEKIELAMHLRGSHQKISVETSSLERPEIFKKAKGIIDELNQKGDEARKYQSLLLRCNSKGEVSGGLFEKRKPHSTFKNLEDELLGQKYSYSPNGFFQINLPVYEMALKRISGLIGETEKVLDLYSGVGTIGLSVARGKDLTLVEVDKSAYGELVKNCEGIPNAKPVLAKSEEALEYILPDSVVILDPPRAGCDKKLIEKLIEVRPKKIIYLSCNPVTQVRDVEMLVEAGAKIETLEGFNFFPRTPHIESLVSVSFDKA